MNIKKRKIIFRDYGSALFFIAIPMAILVPPFLPIIWLIAIPILWKRVSFIKNTFKNGALTTGTIITKKYRRNYWLVEYTYTVHDKQFLTQNLVVGFRLGINVGDEVEIYYDSAKPENAFVKRLYT